MYNTMKVKKIHEVREKQKQVMCTVAESPT